MFVSDYFVIPSQQPICNQLYTRWPQDVTYNISGNSMDKLTFKFKIVIIFTPRIP